jgi:hypothetical protein
MRTVLVIAALAAGSTPAFAQDAPGAPAAPNPSVAQPPPGPAMPPPPAERHGLFGGGGVFGGNISCDGMSCGNFSKGGGAAGYIGYMMSGRFGILFDLWAMTARDSANMNADVTLTFVTSTINARYYLAPAFWVQGGLGDGHAEVHVGVFNARGDDVPVGLLAAGFELVQRRTWALDVALKFAQGTSTQSDSSSGNTTTGRMFGVGANLSFF